MFSVPFSLLVTHFIGDFLLQSNYMALNKSKSFGVLCLHCLVYSLCFLPFGLLFSLITFLTHLGTDFVTSRITSKLWFIDLRLRSTVNPNLKWPFFAMIDTKKRHWFFVAIGFDQLIHYFTLGLTYKFIFN